MGIWRSILNFFATGPDAPSLSSDPAIIHRIFERKRWSVFLSVTLGYAFFYVVRINLSVAKKPMIDEGLFTATQLGEIGTALFIVYAFGKLFNGFLSDRANIRRFMSIALIGAALVNLVLGFNNVFWVFAVLWSLNGWFLSVGSAPSVVCLSRWFSPKEIGTRYGLWSMSHSMGEGATFLITATLVSTWGWQWGFWGPGILALVAGFILLKTLQDRPQTYGLTSVNEYKNDWPVKVESGTGKGSKVGNMQLEVLKNPAIWALGLASANMYVARYGVNNWAMLYLQEAKGYSMIDAGKVLGLYPVFAVGGSLLSGIISDRFFGARRNMPALLMGIMEVAGLTALWLAPPGNQMLDMAALAVFGFGLGALLVYLGGLMAVDLSPKGASGAAMGVIGVFSYIGAAIQDTVTGILLDSAKYTTTAGEILHDFQGAMTFWIAASLASILLTLTVWRKKA